MSSSSSSSESSAVVVGNRGIWLRRYATTTYPLHETQGFRLRVEAYGGSLVENEIFRYQSRPSNPALLEDVLEFDGVCSVADLSEFAKDLPVPGVFPSFCRLAAVDLVFRSRTTLDDAWSTLVAEVEALVNALDLADKFDDPLDIAIGDPPPADPPELP